MKIGLSNNPTPTILVYGSPKVGKTACLPTWLPEGEMLYCYAPGEGNAMSSIAKYCIGGTRKTGIMPFKIECVEDLLALESVLSNKLDSWRGEESWAQYMAKSPPRKIVVEEVRNAIKGHNFTAFVFDGVSSLMRDLFYKESPSNDGRQKYGDVAACITNHIQYWNTMPGFKLVILITQDDQEVDQNVDGGITKTRRIPLFIGNAWKDTVPAFIDFMLPILPGSTFGERLKNSGQWEVIIDGTKELRDRWFATKSVGGYWAGGRVPIDTDYSDLEKYGAGGGGLIPADLSSFYRRYYCKKEK